ncbi:MAG: hypothetical protein OEZ04_12655 [Nitrospinota bacterium]|nr:hypothetical protein [Nitrospinota bacterium]
MGCAAPRLLINNHAMAGRFWIALLTLEEWNLFSSDGASMLLFPPRRKKVVAQITPGDMILVYVKDVSAFTAVVEAVSPHQHVPAAEAHSPPMLHTTPVALLDTASAINPLLLRDRLSIFHGAQQKASWTDYFRLSPAPWPSADGATILRAIRRAAAGDSNDTQSQYVHCGKLGMAALPPASERETLPPGLLKAAKTLATTGRAEGRSVWIHPALAAEGNIVSDPIPAELSGSAPRFVERLDAAWFEDANLKAAFAMALSTSIIEAMGALADVAAVADTADTTLFIIADRESAPLVRAHAMRPFMKLAIADRGLKLLFVPLEALQPDGVAGMLENIAEDCIIEGVNGGT